MSTPLKVRAAVALALIPLGGCALFSGACGESRVVYLYAAADGSDVRDLGQQASHSTVGLSENRGRAVPSGFERTMQWSVVMDSVRGAPTAVHLHQGVPGSGGPLLYDLPLDGAEPTYGVLASGYVSEYETVVGSWYRGALPFLELMVILYQSPTYLEVHSDSQPGGVRAALGTPRFLAPPDDPRGWYTYYCS